MPSPDLDWVPWCLALGGTYATKELGLFNKGGAIRLLACSQGMTSQALGMNRSGIPLKETIGDGSYMGPFQLVQCLSNQQDQFTQACYLPHFNGNPIPLKVMIEST